jgi:sugar phosphate isomerase/epimerase
MLKPWCPNLNVPLSWAHRYGTASGSDLPVPSKLSGDRWQVATARCTVPPPPPIAQTKPSRRYFLTSLLSTAAAPALIRAARTRRLPIAFSTLGCPGWAWQQILSQAAALGYSGIELRGIQGEMDLTKCKEFAQAQIKTSMSDLKALDLRITDLGASTRLHEYEPAKRAAALDEGRRFVDLAHQLKVPFVRVFGDKVTAGQTREATIERIIEGMNLLGQHARGSGVAVLLESHGDFTDSGSLLRILKASEMRTTGLLWDTHHTVASGKEQPAETFKNLGRYVRHVHIKDSQPNGEEVRYVLTGTGTIPVAEIVRVLVDGGYKGYYCYEWEKVWHKEIEEPEIAFPHYAKVMTRYLADNGIKS